MLDMLHADFKGYEREQNMLRYEGPKFGNDDDFVDSIAVQLLDWYADALEGKEKRPRRLLPRRHGLRHVLHLALERGARLSRRPQRA